MSEKLAFLLRGMHWKYGLDILGCGECWYALMTLQKFPSVLLMIFACKHIVCKVLRGANSTS
jgi:hypothetical protein